MDSDSLMKLFDSKEILKMTETTYDAIADKFTPLLSIKNASAEEVKAVNSFIDRFPCKSTIADLGCGVGKHGRYCAQKGFAVYGFDISSNMIKLAEQY